MYYPIGWHKVLNLDTEDTGSIEYPNNILQVQANHERELFLILTSRSLHIWFPKPAAEIVCHRRSKESIERIGLNKSAIWKTDSSVIVVATEKDQLLFYQIKKRSSSNSATSFLLPASLNGGDGIYRFKHDQKNTKKMLNGQLPPDTSEFEQIPALTIFSFGKLDLSSVGISCLMAAEEELVVGSKNCDMYGVQWDGSVDDKFPWSLSKAVQNRGDYLTDLKFSSVLSGFAMVFNSGRVGFMPLRSTVTDPDASRGSDVMNCDTSISYLSSVNDAVCAEINHRNRLIAFGLKTSRVVVCNIGEDNSKLIVNHQLEVDIDQIPQKVMNLGAIRAMKYSPDNTALAISWEGGHFGIWSAFGSLLYCSQQWQLECDNGAPIKSIKVQSLAWSREGYNLWLCSRFESNLINDNGNNSAMTDSVVTSIDGEFVHHDIINGLEQEGASCEEVYIVPLARSNLISSPHSTCSTDSIVLMSEQKIFIGPSVPQEDKFDHWISLEVAQSYLQNQQPMRYAVVDRECKNLAVAGLKGLALYSIEDGTWRFLPKKSQENSFTICGDLIWWHDYLIASCFNFQSHTFELRAYETSESEAKPLNDVVIQPIRSEIVRMSIFENRLLVLYVDGTLGMFMMNLRKRPTSLRSKRPASLMLRSSSIVSASGRLLGNNQNSNHISNNDTVKTKRSDSIVSQQSDLNPLPSSVSYFDCRSVTLQISPIENLIISNLQANPYCISAIALTRLHFKNNRFDDSILLNACGKLFLLEREAPPDPYQSLTTSVSTPDPTTTTPDKFRESTSQGTMDAYEANSNNVISNSTDDAIKVHSPRALTNSVHLASASLKTATTLNESSALSNVTFKAVSVIATNVEQFWISPEISTASEMSYFKRSLWLFCGSSTESRNAHQQSQNGQRHLQVWLPLLNDKNDPPNDLYVPDRIMLPIRCDIYPLAIRSSSSSTNLIQGQLIDDMPDDTIVLGAESDILYKDCKLFTHFPYTTVKRQCRVYLHRILRELLLGQHLGYYAKKIADSCQKLPYFAHCFELLLHEVLEEEATSPVPLPDPMLPQVVKFIKQFPHVYLETVVHCARKSELSMWSHLFDERAVGNPRRLFQECLERQKLDIAASCLIILQSLDRNIVSSRMVKELMRSVKDNDKFHHLIEDLESFISRAELDRSMIDSPNHNMDRS